MTDPIDEIIAKIHADYDDTMTQEDMFRAVCEAGIKHGMMEAPIIDRKHCEAIACRKLAKELLTDIDEAVGTLGPEHGLHLFKTHLREIAKEEA